MLKKAIDMPESVTRTALTTSAVEMLKEGVTKVDLPTVCDLLLEGECDLLGFYTVFVTFQFIVELLFFLFQNQNIVLNDFSVLETCCAYLPMI